MNSCNQQSGELKHPIPMWLADVDHVWDGSPDDDIRGAELALSMLERTRVILHYGENWRGTHLATTRSNKSCDPLSERAVFFSLAGAASRARWTMREEMAECEINPIHLQQVMTTLVDFEKRYRGETHGWMFVDAFLEGLQSALGQYVVERLSETNAGHEAA